jgi:cytochrome c556
MRGLLPTGVVVASVMMVMGCATGKPAMSTADAIAARQQLMKDQGAALRSITEKAKAGQVEAIAVDADKLAKTAKDITPLFPPNSLDPNVSRAKPEIWQKWSEFETAAKTLETRATQLAATAKTGDAAKTNAALSDFGKVACGSCHTPFRGPEIKK